MEGFFAEKSYSTKIPPTNYEQIDLTLKLSPCGQDAKEKWLTRWSSISEEKSKTQEDPFVVCLDRSWSLPVSVEGEKGLMRFGDLQTRRRVRTGKRLLLEKQRRAAEAAEGDKSKLKTLPNPSSDSWHQVGASSNIQMPLSPSFDTKLESPAKKPKHVNPYVEKGDAMNILR